MFIKKFYGPLKVLSSDDGRHMVWYNKDKVRVFELTGGTDISIKSDYFYSLIDFISPTNPSERSVIMKGLYKYFEELSGKKILDITTF